MVFIDAKRDEMWSLSVLVGVAWATGVCNVADPGVGVMAGWAWVDEATRKSSAITESTCRFRYLTNRTKKQQEYEVRECTITVRFLSEATWERFFLDVNQ